MDVAAAVDDLVGLDAHALVDALAPDLVVDLLERVDGQLVVLVAVLRDDDAVVGHEVVHVGGDQRLVGDARLGVLVGVDGVAGGLVHVQRLHGHAELVDLQLAALGVNRVGEGLVGGVALLVERVLGVVGPDADHDARGDEGGDVVDVAVGLLGVDALLDPDDLLDAEVVLEVLGHVPAKLLAPGLELLAVLGPDGLGVLLLEHRGAGAAGGQEALVGDDEGALAVDGDGAALEDHVVGTVAAAAGELGHLEGDLLVLVPREVEAVDEAAVAVEVPVVGALLALAVDDVGGAGVAEPGVVGGHLDDGDVLVVLEDGLAVGVVDLVGAHVDRGELGDGAGDGGILPLGGLGAVGPGVGAVGPAHPHAVLGGELGGHEEAVGPRGGLGLGDRTHKISSKPDDRLPRAGCPRPRTKRWRAPVPRQGSGRPGPVFTGSHRRATT